MYSAATMAPNHDRVVRLMVVTKKEPPASVNKNLDSFFSTEISDTVPHRLLPQVGSNIY
jgi:hypothetical protein